MKWEELVFSKLFTDQTGGNKKVLTTEYLTEGNLPIVDQGKKLVAGFINDLSAQCKAPLPCLIFGDHTKAIKYIDFPFAIGADGTKILIPDSRLDPKFAYYALKRIGFPAKTGYMRHFEYLKRAKLHLPPLEEQKRIAAILDKADAIRKKRKQAIELSEQFLRSAFLDMFGDPITNPKGWKLRKLGGLSVKFSDGPFGSNLKSSHYVNDGVRVIRLQNIGVGEFLDGDKAYVSRKHFQTLMKHQCLPGDILIGTLGSPNLRACVLPTHINEALNKADCIQMRPDLNVVTTEYVVALLNQPGTLALASHLLHGQTRTRISMGTLRNLEVTVPPLETQKKFENIVRLIKSKIKISQSNSHSETTNCFDSLVQSAFRGQL
jgi:type I restriction enzyme S subunit